MTLPVAVDRIVQRVTEKAGNEQTPRQGPDTDDQRAFDKAMHGGNGIGTQPQQPASIQEHSVDAASDHGTAAQDTHRDVVGLGRNEGPEIPSTPGDKVLESLDKTRSQYRNVTNEVNSASANGEASSPEELFRLSVKVAGVTVKEQLAASVGGKADQDVQTLLKG
jgi:hypothetical protein